jgi:YidC/Oxa1 family membrane protein insertase
MSKIYDWLAIPFGWLLGVIYEWFNSYWLALFILVLIVRLVLLPSAISQQKSSAKQIRLQPKVNRIRAKYATGGQPTREQQQKIQEETQQLYQKEGYSAMNAGCIPLLIQFPILMGLYGVVYEPLSKVLRISDSVIQAAADALNIKLSSSSGGLKNEINILNAVTANNMPAGLSEYSDELLRLQHQFNIFGVDLTQKPDIKSPGLIWLIPILAFAASILTCIITYSKQKQTNPEMAKNPSMGCMSFMPAVFSLVFTFMFPAGVGVYWIMSSVISFIQTLVLNYTHAPQKVIAMNMVDETVERRSREESIKKLKKFSESKDD